MTPRGWSATTLGAIASSYHGLVDGPFGSNLPASDYTSQGVPVIRGSNLSLGTYRFHDDGFVWVSEETATRLSRSICRPGDIIFTKKGTLGQTGHIPRSARFERYLLSSNQMKLTVDTRICDSLYVYYYVSAPRSRERIIQDASVAGVPKTNVAYLRGFPISLPPLSTQRKITAILSAYDGLIENNNRRIKLLEEMAQRIYREWFIHFRYPGCDINNVSDSCLGDLPKGWEAGRLDDLLVLQRGFDLPTAERVGGSVPVIAASGIHGFHDESKVPGPGVVTGRSGTIGLVAYVHEDYWPLNTTLWVKEFKRSSPRTAYFLLRDLGLEQYASGAAVPTLNRNHVHGLPLPVPPQRLIKEFDDVSLPIMQLQRTLTQECERLVRARNLLLPRLVTGEIDVSDLHLDAMLEGALGESGAILRGRTGRAASG